MELFIKLQISRMKSLYPAGTCVVLFGVDGVPDGTTGNVDFVDDVGYVFIETPEGLSNIRLSSADENTRFFKK